MDSNSRSILLVGNFLSKANGTRGACEDLAEQLENVDWFVIRTSTKPRRLLRLIDIVKTIVLRCNDYSIAQVEVYSGLAFGLAEVSCWLLRKFGKQIVITLHGGGLVDFFRQHPKRVTRLLQCAAAVTTPSHFLEENFKCIRSDISYIPNGLPISDYQFVKSERLPLSPNLVWLRAFHYSYNPLMAVRVIELLRDEFPAIHLTMYGPDKGDGSLPQVRAYIEVQGMGKFINIPGAIPKKQVPEILSHYDLFLNTTRLESFGVCVAEAAASGLPVVSTNVGELPYLWKDGEEVLLMDSDDTEAMAAAVRRLLSEPGLATTLSRNARSKVEQFDWSVVLPQWQNLFASIS